MNRNKHLEKARRMEKSGEKLDPEEDWELIVEDIYGTALHYIAFICDIKIGNHMETHKGLPKFLDDNGLNSLSQWFREIDVLRMGRWYGGQSDGETVRLARKALVNIKSMVEECNNEE